MTALIVGGDKVNKFENYLKQRGYQSVDHWSGRKPSDCHKTLPKSTELIVLMVDYLNHGMAFRIKKMAEILNVPVVYTSHSIADLDSAFRKLIH